MAVNNKGGGRVTLSEINVTPFVDVMLVLLIIFMVTAPMIEQGVEVDLPNTETVEIRPDEGKSIITIQADGKVMLGKAEVPYEKIGELTEKLIHNYKLKQEDIVYLHADENTRYGLVAQIMASLKKAGVARIGMVTEALDGQEDPPVK